MIIGALLVRVGAEPFVDGLRQITLLTILIALAITLLTTVCAAWRWSIVADRLGAPIPLRSAVAAYYRSQFVNATLPGGVLGDVHRAVRHGRDTGMMAVGVRGVAWERSLGHVVYVVLALGVVVALPSGLRAPVVLLAAVTAVGLGVAVLLFRPLLGRSQAGDGLRRSVRADARAVLGDGPARRGVMLASIAAVVGHTSILVVAARTADVATPTPELLPVLMIVLLAAAVPMNIAGWGPREGIAAAAFGSVGLSAEQGVTVAVVYGVLALIATAPGALLLIAQGAPRPVDATTSPPPGAVDVVTVGGPAHG